MKSEVPGSMLTGGNISLLEIVGFHVVNHLIFSLDHLHMPICYYCVPYAFFPLRTNYTSLYVATLPNNSLKIHNAQTNNNNSCLSCVRY